MYVASTLNAENKSRGLVRAAVCSYAGKRKFVAKSEEYEETLKAIRKAFDLRPDTPVTLSTSSLDVCRGQAVEIDEIAYPLLWEYVDEVAITTPEEAASTAPIITQARRKSRISSVTATARKSLALTARLSDIQSLPSRRVSSSSIGEPPAMTDTQEEEAAENIIEAELLDVVMKEQEENIPEEEHEEHVDEPSKSMHHKAAPPIDNLFNDDDVVEARPSRYRARDPSPPPTPSPTSKKATPFTSLSLGERHIKAEKAEPRKSKFKPKAESSSKPRHREPSPPPAPKVKPIAPPMDENSRIAIVITGPGDNISAQFKMRGKHQIKKILKTACQNFDLEFERATLYLVDEELEDENGEPLVTELPKDKTALECGILNGARLVIHIDEDGDEEDGEDY